MLRAEAGFTLIEVLVAATVLVVGLGGTLGLVMGANSSTTSAANTEGGTNLAREVIERVRELPISQVTPATVASALQGMSGLANTSGAGTWTVTRRNTTYTLSVDVCAVDDPKDGSGPHGGATFCVNGGAAGTADTQPQDYLRVTADVTWRGKSGQTRHVTQTSLISGRGADGPGVTDVRATSPGPPTIANPVAPIVSNTTTTNITFTITADSRAAHVYVLVDGSPVGQATAGANNTWTYNLDVTPANRPDKSYEVAAYADDSRGVQGPSFFIPLLLNRFAPAAPSNVVGSVNTVYYSGVATAVVEVQWDANGEANVIGYQVYRPDGILVCDLRYTDDDDDHTHCIDPNPQDGNYQVAAVYQDAGNNINYSPRANTATPVVVFPPRTWFLDNHQRNTGAGTPCVTSSPGPDKVYDLAEMPTSGLFAYGNNKAQNAGKGSDNHRFCGPAISGPIRAGASNAVLNLYMKNTDAITCAATISATIGGLTLPAKQLNVTPAATLSLYTVTWPITAQTIATGSRPVLDIDWDPARSCDKGEEDFNSLTTASALSIPTVDYPEPKPPTNVTSSTTSDGLQLSWNAPTSSPLAVSFYRIYRDGYNYDNRYDETDDAASICSGSPSVCTYTDPDRTSGSHTYFVTSVAANLQESDPAPLPPATFP